jgi:hypothetical protein
MRILILFKINNYFDWILFSYRKFLHLTMSIRNWRKDSQVSNLLWYGIQRLFECRNSHQRWTTLTTCKNVCWHKRKTSFMLNASR